MTIAGDKFGKTFNALTGLELRAKILSDISDLLMNDDRFTNNVAYPKVAYRFGLTVAVYPAEPATFQLERKAEVGECAPGVQAVTIELGKEHGGTGPNEIRQELGLPVPKPTVTSTGVVDLADKDEHIPRVLPAATLPAAPQEKPLERVTVSGMAGERSEAVEIPGHIVDPHEFAIPETPVVSVVQRTNAAPGGREVVDNVPRRIRNTAGDAGLL